MNALRTSNRGDGTDNNTFFAMMCVVEAIICCRIRI